MVRYRASRYVEDYIPARVTDLPDMANTYPFPVGGMVIPMFAG